jgi:hypothetical protein
LWSCGE